MQTIETKKAAAKEIEGRVAAEHFARQGVTKASIFALLERYYAAYDAMTDVQLPVPGGGAAKPACAKGCAFCCHTIVVVTAPEAFYVADFIRRTRAPEEFARTVEHVLATDAATRGLDGAQRWGSGPPCPLLDRGSGACSVYPGRPLPCRGLLSSSRACCERAFAERVEKPVFDAAQPFLFQNADVYTHALAFGLRAAGRALYRLELIAALATIWSVDDAFERWLAGEEIFDAARAPKAELPIV